MLQEVESLTGEVGSTRIIEGNLNAGSVSIGATEEEVENAIKTSITTALEGEY